MTEDLSAMPTPELENLLRRTDLSSSRQEEVEVELNRRYTEELLGNPVPPPRQPPQGRPPVPPPQNQQPVFPPHQGQLPPQQGGVPFRYRTPAKPGSSVGKTVAWVVALLLAGVVTVVVVAVLLIDDSSPAVRTGTVCVVRGDSCPMQVGLPVGSSCVCSDGFNEFPGVVQ